MSFVRNLCVIAALTAAIGTGQAVEVGQWVQATTFADPEGLWVDPAASSDESPSTYASDISNRVGDGPFLECGFDASVHTDHLQVTADFGFGIVDSVQLDALVEGSWTTLYTGAIGNAEQTVLSFTPVDTERIRFRFHYLQSGYYFWLYDLRVFASPPAVMPPRVTTLPASSVTASTAVLHGEIDDDGGGLCQVRFEYGLDQTYGNAVDWSGSYSTAQTASSVVLDVAGLLTDTTYHYHLLARNASGTVVDGGDQVFHTAPIEEGTVEWIAPSGFDTADTAWSMKSAGMDDDPTTSARHYHLIGDDQWSPDVTYTLAPLRTEYVRFTAGHSTYIDAIHIDVHRDGNWVVAYEGDFADRTPQICGFDSGLVDGVRVRFHVSTTQVGMYEDLYEISVRVHSVITFADTASRVTQGAGAITLPLSIRPASSVPVSVSWSMSGDAQLGTDLASTSPVVFPVGQTTASLAVLVLSSGAAVDRSAVFQLTSPVAASIGSPSTYTLTIGAAGGPNQPPVVNAGSNQTVAIATGATLTGTATDDSLPNNTLTVQWSVVSGPGSVTFANPNAATTTASFTLAGSYDLRLTASDGALSASSDVTVTVLPGTTNLPPFVFVGGNQTIAFGDVAHLDGIAFDDGQPNGTLATAWSTVSGPASASFVDPHAATTLATFPAAGVYDLRLTADDGALNSSADLVVTVVATSGGPTIATPASATPNPVTGTTATLNALGASPLGESKLTYDWVLISGPALVKFPMGSSGNNSAKTEGVTFTATGTYLIRCIVSDPNGRTAASDVTVTVAATPASVTIDPSSTSVAPLGSVAFTATVRDQFNAIVAASVAPVQWSVDALASIGADGVCSAGSAPGSTTVHATVTVAGKTTAGTAALLVSQPTVASRSPLVEPQLFRADAWSSDPAYASAYVAAEDPARALVSASDGPGVPRLVATAGTYFCPNASGVATLSVRGAPGAPVAFLCLGRGVLAATKGDQKYATVTAGADGLATISFRPGGREPDAVVASSPSASGSVRFTIEP